MTRLLSTILATVFVLAGCASSALAERRFALVIGNSDYESVGDLPNASNDAELISARLRSVGFETELLIDQSEDAFGEALDRLASAAHELDVVAVYYAGHGIQKGGENYLIPVDAELKNESAIERETISLKSIMDVLERVPVSLLFLDACRDNPLANDLAGKSNASGRNAVAKGLAVVRPIGDMLITFATLPNSVASDGQSDNSPFARSLAKHIPTPNTEVSILMKRVTKDVLEETRGEQRPQQLSQMQKEFYFASAKEPDAAVETAVTSRPSILSVYPAKVSLGQEVAVVADVAEACIPAFFNVSPSKRVTPIPARFFKTVVFGNGQVRYEISPGSRYGLVVQKEDENGRNRLGFICQPDSMSAEEKKTFLTTLLSKFSDGNLEGELSGISYQFREYEIE